MLRLRDVVRPELLDFGKLSHNMKAVATLGRPARDRDVLTAVCILLPLWLTRDRVTLAGAGPLFAFFVSIGLGFMLIETSQMQRLIIALGHPTYGLSVVLFALLLSSGIGSFLTTGVTAETAPRLGRAASAGAGRRPGGLRAPHAADRPLDRADDDRRPDRRRGGAALSGRPGDGHGVSARHEAGGRARVAS